MRDLLDGKTVDTRGAAVMLEHVALDWPPEQVPTLLIGGRGPRTIRLGGELTDGILLDASATVSDVTAATALAGEGRASSGRDGASRVIVYVELDTAKPNLIDRVRRAVSQFQRAGADTVVLQGSAEQPDPTPLIEAIAGLSGCG